MAEVIRPMAVDAQAWKQAQHNALVEEIIASLGKGDIDDKVATTLLQACGNISAFRQKLEAEKLIPPQERVRGKSALASLFGE